MPHHTKQSMTYRFVDDDTQNTPPAYSHGPRFSAQPSGSSPAVPAPAVSTSIDTPKTSAWAMDVLSKTLIINHPVVNSTPLVPLVPKHTSMQYAQSTSPRPLFRHLETTEKRPSHPAPKQQSRDTSKKNTSVATKPLLRPLRAQNDTSAEIEQPKAESESRLDNSDTWALRHVTMPADETLPTPEDTLNSEPVALTMPAYNANTNVDLREKGDPSTTRIHNAYPGHDNKLLTITDRQVTKHAITSNEQNEIPKSTKTCQHKFVDGTNNLKKRTTTYYNKLVDRTNKVVKGTGKRIRRLLKSNQVIESKAPKNRQTTQKKGLSTASNDFITENITQNFYAFEPSDLDDSREALIEQNPESSLKKDVIDTEDKQQSIDTNASEVESRYLDDSQIQLIDTQSAGQSAPNQPPAKTVLQKAQNVKQKIWNTSKDAGKTIFNKGSKLLSFWNNKPLQTNEKNDQHPTMSTMASTNADTTHPVTPDKSHDPDMSTAHLINKDANYTVKREEADLTINQSKQRLLILHDTDDE